MIFAAPCRRAPRGLPPPVVPYLWLFKFPQVHYADVPSTKAISEGQSGFLCEWDRLGVGHIIKVVEGLTADDLPYKLYKRAKTPSLAGSRHGNRPVPDEKAPHTTQISIEATPLEIIVPKTGRAAEAFQSLCSHTDGKIRDGYGEDGCGRKVVVSVIIREKVWSLAFADDLVIVAKNEQEMMKNLGKYVGKKKLEVNVEKTKLMVFNNRKKKSEENEWNRDGRKEPRIRNISERC
ncbi:hypothetical protein GEV33_004972 [Tenebrio molitor]|uniref:Reverse transcriptase domain-containing protein n=1 Tax=Tenebrio molitor TaxID=7067 RepID=A0A8J6HNC9_TENMO|nr:hypothetical protein GEV33_004972 [Tenebrio molitor]